jgi:hypothetical protein
MSTTTPKSLKCWRSIFLVLEVLVVVVFLGGWIAERFFDAAWEPTFDLASVAVGVVLMLSWLFLLIASPFFLRSLRGVALAGWIIAFGLLAIAALNPGL